jgi:hypothetical protein
MYVPNVSGVRLKDREKVGKEREESKEKRIDSYGE